MLKADEIFSILERIRNGRPLIHNISNYVVMNFSANALLAIGASPVMAHAEEEVEEMAAASQALVINIGTLSNPWIKAMSKAMKTARASEIPIVFDPVGMGATQFRTQTTEALLKEYGAHVIRGNVSEFLALAGLNGKIKGVDSHSIFFSDLSKLRDLAQKFKSVLCMSGSTDFVTDGQTLYAIDNGDSLMAQVTGMGCTATAIIGACLAVEKSPLKATLTAMTLMGIAGEIAKEKSAGPGSFQIAFLDALGNFSKKHLDRLRLREMKP